MSLKLNCIYNESGYYCTNKKVKRSLFGIGARKCCEMSHKPSPCEFKELVEMPSVKTTTLEFTVEEVGFTSENNHGYLKLKLPYQYEKIKGRVKDGDKVNVGFKYVN